MGSVICAEEILENTKLKSKARQIPIKNDDLYFIYRVIKVFV
ncbi:hypothetical protein [Nostoc sp. FACHB-133]|nr:hypothetical protein [Nostoc sp. FACHB-133]